MSETHYTPGVCNINEAEVAYRKKAFYLGLGVGLPLLAVLLVLKASPVTGLLMFLPGWIGAIGYLQAKHKFCVGYAASGVYNQSDEYAETQKIIDSAKRDLDTKRARQINLQSLAAGAATAAVSVLLLIVVRSI